MKHTSNSTLKSGITVSWLQSPVYPKIQITTTTQNKLGHSQTCMSLLELVKIYDMINTFLQLKIITHFQSFQPTIACIHTLGGNGSESHDLLHPYADLGVNPPIHGNTQCMLKYSNQIQSLRISSSIQYSHDSRAWNITSRSGPATVDKKVSKSKSKARDADMLLM